MSLDEMYRLAQLEKERGLPRGILEPQIQQESAGNPNAVSNKGAAGIMQIMPDTARDPGYGVRPLQGWDGRDPRTAPVEEQIRFGADYMAAMSKKFDGDTAKTLAAYNAGPGAVEQAGGVPSFAETQDYVKKITGNMKLQDDNSPLDDLDAQIAALEADLGMVSDTTGGLDLDSEIAQLEADLTPSAQNPLVGAQIAAPLADAGENGDLQWFERGNDWQAKQNGLRGDSAINPMYYSPHIPIPVNQDALALTGQAVGRGVADMIGAPIDLLNFARTGAAGAVNTILPENMEFNPVPIETGSSDSIANAFGGVVEDTGYPVRDPADMQGSEKTIYNMIRFGAGAGAGGASMAARANKLKSTGKELGPLTKPYEGAPVRQVLDDVATGVGAGYGSSVAEDIAPDSTAAQVAGTLAGGGITSSATRSLESVAKYPFKKGEGMIKQELPDGTNETRRTVRDASRNIQGMASDPEKASQNLKEMNRIADENGVTRLSTGVAADDIGLSLEENRRRVRNGQPYLERDQKIRTETSDAISNLRDPNADIEAPQQLARQERDRQVGEAKKVADQAQKNLSTAEQQAINIDRDTEAFVDPVRQERGRGAEASKQLDDQIGSEGALGERTKVKNQKFDEAAGDQVTDITPLKESIDKVEKRINALGGLGQETGLPGDFVQRVKSLSEKGEKVPLKDVSGIRKNITSSIARARQAGNFDLVDDLSTLKKDVNKVVDETASFEDAQKYYREEYAPFFAQGYGKKYRDTIQRSSERTGKADSGRIAEIFLNGTPDAAEDLKRIVDIAPDPKAASAAVERYMAADLASTLGANPSPRSIANWIKNRSAQLDQFPDIKKKFEVLQKKVGSQEMKKDQLKLEIDQISNQFKRAEKNTIATERRINKGVLGTLINDDPDRYVKNIMSGDDRLQKLDEVNKLIGKNEQARAGLKRAVTEHLMDELTGTNVKMTDGVDGPIQYAAIAKLMKKNEDALIKVYTPQEMNVLRRSQKILGQYGNLSKRATTGSDTAEKTRLGKVALETGLRLKYGVLKAGGIMRTVKDAVAQLSPNSQYNKTDSVVARAMLDPELAVHLLDTPVSEISKPKWNKKLQFLITGMAGGREVGDEDEE